MSQSLRTSLRLAVDALAFGIVWGTFTMTPVAAGDGRASPSEPATGLEISVRAVRGFAVPGTDTPVTLHVVVTDRATGAPMASQPNFEIVDPSTTSGAVCGFRGRIESVANLPDGGYRLTVISDDLAPGCMWDPGNYSGQLMASIGGMKGRTGFRLTFE